MNLIKTIIRYALYMVLACVFFSCTSKKEGEIVMDKDGNYYKLTHKNAFMGAEMYRLEPIDTTKYEVKGFNAR